MPVTQHAPPPVSLPKDLHDKVTSPRSPILSDSRTVESKPVSQHQSALRLSPPPLSRLTSPPSPPPKNGDVTSPSRPTHTPVKETTEKSLPKEEEETPPDDDIIDEETFNQILELDEDDEDQEFSRGMVWEYFDQAQETFVKLEDALKKKDLENLSHLGHFLKGSSASLGISHVQAACTNIQHYGLLRDEEREVDLTEEQALEMISKQLAKAQTEYARAEKWFKEYYGVNS